MAKRKEYQRLYPHFDAQLPNNCSNCEKSDGTLHIHHIVPLALGGNNIISNLVRLCSDCHALIHEGAPLVELAEKRLLDGVKSGKVRNGAPPYGYSIIDGRYVPNADADVVRWIFNLRYKCEYSTPNIAVILNNFAIPSPKGGKWTHVTAMNIVNNAIYKGETHFNGEFYGNLYEPILDEETIQAIEIFNAKYTDGRVKARKVPDMTT